MTLLSTPWHVASATLVFVSGFVVLMPLGRHIGLTNKRTILLYVWHTLFCLVYLAYLSENRGDALTYFRLSLSESTQFALGTDAVRFITSVLSVNLSMSILGAFLVFNIIGTVGLLAVDRSIRDAAVGASRLIRRLASLIVFLPSISFWSSAIGKDSIAFASCGLALWAALDLGKRYIALSIAILLMLLVRPHMAAIMVMATAIGVLSQRGVSRMQKLVLAMVAVSMATVMLPYSLEYSGLTGDIGVESVADIVEERQGYNLQGGAGIDIAEMSLPFQIVTYLFRPLPFEAHNLPALAASIDNLLLLVLASIGAYCLLIRGRRLPTGVSSTFLWAYVLVSLAVLSSTTANLGISMRQKWMFVPMLMFILLSVIGKRYPRVNPLSVG